jgi:hypothetical protein
MKGKNTIESKINNVATTVKSIESLRSRLFTKMLPELFKEHYAKTVFLPQKTWVVITKDQEYLQKVENVVFDQLADTGDHIKFFDIEKKQLQDPPKDIIALMTVDNTNKKDLPQNNQKI